MLQTSRVLRYSGIALILAVVLLGPYYRGLFFWHELLLGIAVAAAGFGLWSLGRRLGGEPTGLPGGTAGWALLALLGCYVLQFSWAAYFRGNLDWVLRMATVWFAYVAIRGEAGGIARRWVGWVLLFGSFSVAVTGLLHFAGYFAKNPEMSSALALVGLSDRLFTVYQYPNTAAAVFMSAVLVGVGLCLDGNRPKPWVMAIAGGMGGVISLAFFFTLSRGAIVVLPFGLLLLLVGFDWKRVGQGVLLLGALMVAPILVSMHKVAAYQPKLDSAGVMKWAGVSLIVGAVGALALGILFRMRPRLQAALAGALVLAAIGGAVLLRPADGPLIPKSASRLFDMNFKTVNVILRLHYDQDAAEIVADHPLGSGGWGWERSYRRYQDYNYFVRETHNHYAQTAVEAGVPGLIALLSTILLSLWVAFRGRKGDPLRWAMAAGAATIAGHAAIDFDLSYLPVYLTVVILFAATAEPPQAVERSWRWLLGAVPAVGVVGLALTLAVGSRYASAAAEYQAQGDTERATESAKLAQKYDPWATETLLLEDTLAAYERAVRLDPHNPQAWRGLAIQREVAKDYKGAYEASKTALAQQPALVDHYETNAKLTAFLLDEALRSGDQESARRLSGELVALGKQLEARKAVADPLQQNWTAKPLNWSLPLYLHIGKGYFLTGDYARAEESFKAAGQEWNFASEADVWLFALYELQGRKADQKPLEKKPWVNFRNVNPTYKALLVWKP